LTLHKTDAGKADYRNERNKFGSHNASLQKRQPRSQRISPYELVESDDEGWIVDFAAHPPPPVLMDEGSLLLSVDLSRKPAQLSVAGKTLTISRADSASLLYVLSE
jgi:hypothetical protein